MQKEDQIFDAIGTIQTTLVQMQKNISKLQETQDRTILAVVELQSDMKEVKHTVSTLVTRDEYLTGQDQIIKRLDTLETEKASTDSYLKRVREKVGV